MVSSPFAAECYWALHFPHHDRSPWPGTSLHCHPLTPTLFTGLTVLCHHNRSPWPGTSLHCHPLTPTLLTGLTVSSQQVSMARDQFTLPPTYINTPYRSHCFITTGPWPGTSLHCHPLTPTLLTGLIVLCDHNRSEARDQFTLPPTLLTGPIHVITGSVNWK